jgi:hypothetical protein
MSLCACPNPNAHVHFQDGGRTTSFFVQSFGKKTFKSAWKTKTEAISLGNRNGGKLDKMSSSL